MNLVEEKEFQNQDSNNNDFKKDEAYTLDNNNELLSKGKYEYTENSRYSKEDKDKELKYSWFELGVKYKDIDKKQEETDEEYELRIGYK